MKKTLSILALATAALLGNYAAAQVSQADFEALKSIYDTTSGKNWTNNSGWDFSKATAADVKPYDAKNGTGWYGINEIRNGRVSKLELGSNGLKGAFPEAVYQLDGLRTLDLSDNGLTGTLSPKVAVFKVMSSFRVNDNKLAGEIPAEIVMMGAEARTSKPKENGGGGSEIKVLLQKNKFTGSIPANIGDMQLLFKPGKSVSIDFSFNRLTGEIPASVAKLTEVTAFKATNNELTGTVPEAIGNLPNIKYLRLDKNKFTGSVPRK